MTNPIFFIAVFHGSKSIFLSYSVFFLLFWIKPYSLILLHSFTPDPRDQFLKKLWMIQKESEIFFLKMMTNRAETLIRWFISLMPDGVTIVFSLTSITLENAFLPRIFSWTSPLMIFRSLRMLSWFFRYFYRFGSPKDV